MRSGGFDTDRQEFNPDIEVRESAQASVQPVPRDMLQVSEIGDRIDSFRSFHVASQISPSSVPIRAEVDSEVYRLTRFEIWNDHFTCLGERQRGLAIK